MSVPEKKNDDKPTTAAELKAAQRRWLDNRDDPEALEALLAAEANLPEGDKPPG